MAEILLWQQERNTTPIKHSRVFHLRAGNEYAKQIVGSGGIPFSELHQEKEIEIIPEKLKPARFAQIIAETIQKHNRKTYTFKILVNKGENREDATYVNLTIQEEFIIIPKKEFEERKDEYHEALEEYCESKNIYAMYLAD